jgi:hypothetical protein
MSFLTYITGFFMNFELLPILTDYAKIDKSKGEDSAIIRYATPILKDPGLIIKIAENGLKAIGIIALCVFE